MMMCYTSIYITNFSMFLLLHSFILGGKRAKSQATFRGEVVCNDKYFISDAYIIYQACSFISKNTGSEFLF